LIILNKCFINISCPS